MVPATGLLKGIAAVVAPSQYATLATGLTVVDGFTVMVNVSGVPTHPLAVGVTVMVAITGAVPVFVAVNDGMLPVPLAPSPMVGSLFVHANVAPASGLAKVIAVVVAPLQ